MNLLDLNDDCLKHLCRFFDSESIVTTAQTCTRLRYLAEDYFKYKKSYTCYIDSLESKVIAVTTLRILGEHLTKVDLTVDPEYRGEMTEFFTLLGTSVGTKLIEFSILGKICSMPLQILAPIFRNLEVLTLQSMCWGKNCVSKIDLPPLCPNLQKLVVYGQIVFATERHKTFRRLQSLDVAFSSLRVPTEVFYQNQHLTMLSLRYRPYARKVNLTPLNATALRNLVKLHLDVRLIDNPTERLPSLFHFESLQSLELFSIPAASFNDTLKILETLVRLTEIVLQCHMTRLESQFSTIQESLPSMAAKLQHLTSFITANIDWTEESVANFVRRAPKLIYLDFWSGSESNYTVTPEFIRSLATIRRTSIYSHEPLHLKLYIMSDGLKQVFNEPGVETSIKLAK